MEFSFSILLSFQLLKHKDLCSIKIATIIFMSTAAVIQAWYIDSHQSMRNNPYFAMLLLNIFFPELHFCFWMHFHRPDFNIMQ